ncbi:hypothetical protein [Leptospira stimsonii]|uniref:Uncharacterized protein n=1 Tax=Leptospira stimsonii TaxID=2202203 RepID=A0ABY2N3T4_9LEPT|nr:hypothetical protein [Leptospira stimsonii]TGK22816.1 hypothetical protein EHO98_05925 [Leptospira stimsonii]TGM14988.1 hypothetical protein EHQ90_10970 [Leptospira stimsonii]
MKSIKSKISKLVFFHFGMILSLLILHFATVIILAPVRKSFVSDTKDLKNIEIEVSDSKIKIAIGR